MKQEISKRAGPPRKAYVAPSPQMGWREGNALKGSRLAALQRSGSENWKKRLGGRPPILLKPDTPVMRVREKPTGERPKSLLDRIMMLGEAQDQWRNRVEDKDANQFTVAGKMVQMRYSPQASPVISRKKYSPKPVQSRSKTKQRNTVKIETKNIENPDHVQWDSVTVKTS
ncbi:supervillin [Trichonephila clavipes]|nr:supervillin [Trichonephila clavipes]